MRNGPHSIRAALEGARRVLIATHVTPDGDALGSAAAFAHIALHQGCEARIFLNEEPPVFLSWLPLPCPVLYDLNDVLPPQGQAQTSPAASPASQAASQANPASPFQPDRIVFVDCADARRAGPGFRDFFIAGGRLTGGLTLNIDHHGSNTGFADVNWVEPERSATGELMGLLAESMGLDLGGDLGLALYLALASDTGNFSYSNTGTETFAMAARIVAAGLDVAEFTDKYENNWSLERMHLWGRLMAEVTLHYNGKAALSKVPLHYLTERGLGKDALEGFASCLRKIAGVRVGVFVREDGVGQSKISLRSMGDVNVAAVTALYGGGGHASAAGAEIAADPDEAARMVLEALGKQLS